MLTASFMASFTHSVWLFLFFGGPPVIAISGILFGVNRKLVWAVAAAAGVFFGIGYANNRLAAYAEYNKELGRQEVLVAAQKALQDSLQAEITAARKQGEDSVRAQIEREKQQEEAAREAEENDKAVAEERAKGSLEGKTVPDSIVYRLNRKRYWTARLKGAK